MPYFSQTEQNKHKEKIKNNKIGINAKKTF